MLSENINNEQLQKMKQNMDRNRANLKPPEYDPDFEDYTEEELVLMKTGQLKGTVI